jgi:large subunit ribosomal protein L19
MDTNLYITQIFNFMKLQELIRSIERNQMDKKLPSIQIGDTIRVSVLIQEGNKQRIQPYEGTVIAQHRAGSNTTITVRRIFQGIGIERIFPVYSSAIQDFNILKRAKVRKAKLYYLRKRVGKATRLKEKFTFTKN